jgi:hypothetical protein
MFISKKVNLWKEEKEENDGNKMIQIQFVGVKWNDKGKVDIFYNLWW